MLQAKYLVTNYTVKIITFKMSMNKQNIVIYLLSLIIFTRAELYLVETETEEETKKQPPTIENYFLDIDISRNVTKDKTNHTGETDQPR